MASEGGLARGGTVLGAFGFGAALPLMVLAYLSRQRFARTRDWLLVRVRSTQSGFAVVLGLLGLAILTGGDKWLEAQVAQVLPDWWARLISAIWRSTRPLATFVTSRTSCGLPDGDVIGLQRSAVTGQYDESPNRFPTRSINEVGTLLAARVEVGFAPLAKCHDDWKQIIAHRGQRILGVRAAIGRWHLCKYATCDEILEARGQYVLRDAQAFLELAEPGHTVKRIPDDQQRPPVPYDV